MFIYKEMQGNKSCICDSISQNFFAVDPVLLIQKYVLIPRPISNSHFLKVVIPCCFSQQCTAVCLIKDTVIYEEYYYLLGYDTVQSSTLTFQRNVLPTSSGLQNKSSKQPASTVMFSGPRIVILFAFPGGTIHCIRNCQQQICICSKLIQTTVR